MRKIRNNFFRFLSFFSVFSVAIILFSCLTVSAQNKITVRVSSETIVESDRIELGKLAQISGESDKSERLKNISLGYAPNVGMTRELNRGQIILAISAAGFSASEIVLETPSKIVVRRAGQEVSPIQIREAVEKSILNQFSIDKITAQIARLDVPEKIQVAVGKLEIRVNVSGVRNLFARFSLPIEIRVDNKTVRRLAATLEIEASAEVFVAAKDLSANAKIGETDVRLERRRLEKPLTNYLRETEKLRGAMLIKNVASGAEITTDFFIAGVVIKSGDSVRIEAQSGNLKITISGEARSSGKIGDRIAVKNLQSKAILQAVVMDEGLVKVIF